MCPAGRYIHDCILESLGHICMITASAWHSFCSLQSKLDCCGFNGESRYYTTENTLDGGVCSADGHPRCNSTDEHTRVVSVGAVVLEFLAVVFRKCCYIHSIYSAVEIHTFRGHYFFCFLSYKLAVLSVPELYHHGAKPSQQLFAGVDLPEL